MTTDGKPEEAKQEEQSAGSEPEQLETVDIDLSFINDIFYLVGIDYRPSQLPDKISASHFNGGLSLGFRAAKHDYFFAIKPLTDSGSMFAMVADVECNCHDRFTTYHQYRVVVSGDGPACVYKQWLGLFNPEKLVEGQETSMYLILTGPSSEPEAETPVAENNTSAPPATDAPIPEADAAADPQAKQPSVFDEGPNGEESEIEQRRRFQ